MTNYIVTASASCMLAVLEADGPEARALESAFHRTLLWRWCKGRRGVPNVENAFRIEALTGGLVTARGWTIPASAAPSVAA